MLLIDFLGNEELFHKEERVSAALQCLSFTLLITCVKCNEAMRFNKLTKLVGNRWVGDKWVN